jgi:hypothetical protein
LLHVALDFDRLTSIGRSPQEALNEMRRSAQYNPDMLVAMDREQHEAETGAATEVPDPAPTEVERQLFRPISEQVLRSLTD